MTERNVNGAIDQVGNKHNKKKLKELAEQQILSEFESYDINTFHPTPWIFYQFLSIEEAAVLSALINMATRAARGERGIKFRWIKGQVWFWCAVSMLCHTLNISGKVENRLIKNLAARGLIQKWTSRVSNRRYLRIDAGALATAIRKAKKLESEYGLEG